jgi:hypothetical protein
MHGLQFARDKSCGALSPFSLETFDRPPLRVAGENPGHPDAETGGAAICSRLRRGAGPLYRCSCKRIPSLEPCMRVPTLCLQGANDTGSKTFFLVFFIYGMVCDTL